MWHNIVTFALPYVLAYFLQILYGLADLFVIGRYCSVDSTTAVSNGAQVMYFFTCVLIGLAMGSTVCVAHAVGAKDKRRTAKAIGNTATMFLAISVVLAAVLLLCRGSIVRLIGTPPEALEGAMEYLTVCFLGIPFIMGYNVVSAVFRGLGDSKSPMLFVAVACVINILLDFLFIGFLGMGPMGAALGTTISQMCSVLLAAFSIRKHLDLRRSDFKPHGFTIKNILKTGVPIAMQDGFVQMGFLLIMVIANGRGVYDAAAVGIVEKFIGLVFIVPSAMLSTVSAIASQNIGASQPGRARLVMKYAMVVTSVYGVVVASVLQVVPEWAVRLFTDDAHVVEMGGVYLKGYAWDCLFAGIHFCFSGFFTACGYSIISFAHNLASIVLARVPGVYLASELYPHTLYPMGLATCLGSVFSCLVCVVAYRWVSKKIERRFFK